VGIDLCAADGSAWPAARRTGAAVCAAGRERGVIIRPLGDTLVLMPAPAMDAETLDQLLLAVAATIEEYFRRSPA
jgi:adenosylmethionine-8-amino-7-oxononanoate aminotransferase